MKRLYRINFAPDCPKLAIKNPDSGESVVAFGGESFADLSPDKPFIGLVDKVAPWSQIYSCGEDALAFSDSAWENCEDMYHVANIGGNEMLAVQVGDTYFSVVNALDFAPIARNKSEPFDISLKFYAPIFRIHCYPHQIFCLSGIGVPGDEFKFSYESFGFRGLIFEEVWAENGVQ